MEGGSLRPLCVFDTKTIAYTDKIADNAWSDIPTCKSVGLDVEYLMLRGIFMAPGVTNEQIAYYVDLMKKVRETPEWTKLMKDGAFNQTLMTGDEYANGSRTKKSATGADEGSWLPAQLARNNFALSADHPRRCSEARR